MYFLIRLLNCLMKDNEDIDHIKVDPTKAYQRFKDEVINADNIDFSDKLGRSLNTGYKSVYNLLFFFYTPLYRFLLILFTNI